MALTRRGTLTAAAAAALAAGRRRAVAQGWPARPIRLIVPFAPGGTTDILGRLAAEGIGQRIGQTVVVENLSGATGNIGAAAAARAAPDGYTLLVGTPGPLAANRFLHRSMPFDSDTAFVAVGLIAVVPNVVMVRRDSPFRSLADLIAALRARPGELRYGDPGVGSTGHLTTELLLATVGARAIHASYRGSQPMLNDLVAGTFDFSTDQLTPALGLVQSGTVRPLAVSTPERSPLIPEVPTFKELGIPIEVSVWFSIVAPAGVPEAVIARLNAALNATLATPEVRARLASLAAAPAGGTPEDLRRVIAREIEYTRRAVQIANLRPE